MRFFSSLILALFFLSANAQRTDHVLGDILVQLEPGVHPKRLLRKLATFQGRPTHMRLVDTVSAPFRIYLYQFDYAQINEVAFLDYVRRMPQVQIAQFNHVLQLRSTIPDDPQFGMQWQYINDGSNGGVVGADLDADLAWDITTGGVTPQGDTIVVCVIDGGIDMDHEDFGDNLWKNWAEIPNNGIDDDNNGYVDDFHGWNAYSDNDEINNNDWHGTNVAGIVGAQGNNSIGVAGVNWNVKVMVVVGGGNEAEALQAYTYPYTLRKRYNDTNGQEGAFVVATNASWGVDFGQPADAPLWCAFYDSLGMQGILNCGATINGNVNVDEEGDLPTACPSDFLISVTNMNNQDEKVTEAGYGATTIDLGAFGAGTFTTQSNNSYGSFGGTSGATPHVAGTIALLYAAPCPTLGELALADPPQAALLARQYILEGVDANASLDSITTTGGRLNMFNSLNLLMTNCGPCPPPASLSATDIIDTAALISWTSLDSTLYVNLRWRKQSDSIWQQVDSLTTNQYLLTGLQACTPYIVALEAVCADTTSGVIPQLTFTTDGCCVPPDDLQVAVDSNMVYCWWTSVLAAQHYSLTLLGPDDTLVIENVDTSAIVLEGLDLCTTYQLFVQTVCDTGITQTATSTIFQTAGCGPCIDLTYCSVEASTDYEFIASVTIDTFTMESGDNGGYAFFGDSLGIVLHTYGIYPLILQPGFTGSSYGEHFRVWIDFNQDGEFDDETELVFETENPVEEAITSTLILGPDLPTGLTRMRVGMVWENLGMPQSCETQEYGEFEDYCILIVAGTPPACLPPALMVDTIGYNWVQLTWEDQPDALKYFVQIRPEGSSEWLVEDVLESEIYFEQLTPCTTYEVRIASQCIGVDGAWSEILTFTTACPPPCDQAPQAIDTADVNFTSLLLSWMAKPNAQGYNLLFRPQGTDQWEDLFVEIEMASLSELAPCTSYELLLQTVCEFGESDFSDTLTFMTACPPPCEAPQAIDTVNVTDSTMVLYWDEVPGAVAYTLFWKPQDSNQWEDLNAPEAEVHLSGLDPCTAYDIQVRTQCMFGESVPGQVFTFMTACPTNTWERFNANLGLRVMPNPFIDQITLWIDLPQSGEVQLRLLHVSGKEILATTQYVISSGPTRLVWMPHRDLPQGFYLLEVDTPWGMGLLRLVKVQ